MAFTLSFLKYRFLPEQVKHEVLRNRDAKIKDALSSFTKLQLPSFPNFCKGYEEYDKFSQVFSSLTTLFDRWLKKILGDVHNQTLPPDKAIARLFDSVAPIECSASIIHAAELRYRRGNPPGKDNKLGDAINWECLLENVPQGEDLYFVSKDSDYQSVVDQTTFNLFLDNEWKIKKHSKIHFFIDLVSFFKIHAQDIKLQEQEENKKEELITGLNSSINFATTHALIAQLQHYSDWSFSQIDKLCTIALENSQIGWILLDSDVQNFYKRIVLLSNQTSDSIQAIRSKFHLPEIVANSNPIK